MDGRLLEVINILTEELEYSKGLATERKLENLYLKSEIEKKDELIKNNLQLAVRMAKITVSNYEKQLLEKDKRISELEMIDRGREVNDILRQVRDGDRLDESGKVKQILEEEEKKLKVFNGENYGDIFKLWGS